MHSSEMDYDKKVLLPNWNVKTKYFLVDIFICKKVHKILMMKIEG